MTEKGTIRVYCDEDLKEALEKLAEADDRSLNNYIVRILTDYVKGEKR